MDAKEDFRLDVRIRMFDGEELAYGKGVNQLLQLCNQHHSLHMAAQEMHMSYRKALQIVQRAERCFNRPLLIRTIGGKEGGGSILTDFCSTLVEAFSRIETEVEASTREKLRHALIGEQ